VTASSRICVQQDVDLEDRLGRQSAGTVGTAGGEQTFVQRLDGFGAQCSQRDGAEVGEDVQAQLAAVAVEGDGP